MPGYSYRLKSNPYLAGDAEADAEGRRVRRRRSALFGPQCL